MDQSEFPVPSPKRQRTESPKPSTDNMADMVDTSTPTASKEKEESNAGNDILDTLMQHIEGGSTNDTDQINAGSTEELHVPNHGGTNIMHMSIDEVTAQPHALSSAPDAPTDGDAMPGDSDQTAQSTTTRQPAQSAIHAVREPPNDSSAAAQVDGIPPLTGEAPVEGAQGAEWEVDSSPYESSSGDSDSSDDTSSEDSDDEDDADGDYAMLDPEEQARILMHGEGGSDDEGGTGKNKSEGAGYKTTNEQMEDVPPIPEITVTTDMPIEELGLVEAIVENNVLIRAKVSGEYQVLESGSLLCFEDRKVAGVVAETLGRVEQPLYTMRFRTGQEIEEKGLQKGKTMFYVKSHSAFVFTQPLKAVKGSDASNIHDEEVGADEMEFSDDEAEAEHKRLLKLKRQGRLGEAGRGRGSARGRGGRGGKGNIGSHNETNGASYSNGSLEMNYDDVEEGEEGYNRLSRPTNLREMVPGAQGAPGTGSQMSNPPRPDRGFGRGRGRGGRDRGRGGNDSFRGRGGPPQHTQQQQMFSPQQGPFNGTYQNMAYPLPFPPPAPMLAPQSQPYPGSFMTSPISPLPQQQYQFGGNFQPSQPQAYQQQYQTFSPSGMQYPGTTHQSNAYADSWQINQAAVAEVQRQLDEMRNNPAQGNRHPSQ